MKKKVSDLKHHPLNSRIYRLSGLDELTHSIETVGLLQPLTIDQNNQIISGNRRFECIKRLGWKTVEVNKMNVKEGDESLMLISANSQRVKSVGEILNEYDELRKYYKKNKTKIGIRVREKVSNDLNVSNGHLARLLFIRKYRPELIDVIEIGDLTAGQAYLQIKRQLKENNSIKINQNYNRSDNNENFKFYQKSSKDLCELEDNSIQTIICSPPYPNSIRVYSKEKGLGDEENVDLYAENLSEHLDECFRVLSPKGSFYLNLGDVFINGHLQSSPHKVLFNLLKRKPYFLRNTIIWKKSNYKPSSSKSNHNPSYEYLFFLTKSKDYDFERVLTPIKNNDKPSHPPRHRSGKKNLDYSKISSYIPNTNGKTLPDFWSDDLIETSVAHQSKLMGIEHPALYPSNLVTIPILQSCVIPSLKKGIEPHKIDHTVLDVFAGALSTYEGVKKINTQFGSNLKFVGYDIKKYF